MKITDSIQDVRQHYQAKGWVVVDNVFEKHAIESIANLTDQIMAQETSEGKIHSLDGEGTGRVAPRKLNAPFTKNEKYKEFLNCEYLLTLLSELIQDEVCLFSDQIFLKPPLIGSEKPYHQDNEYFKCTPANKIITAWIALDDVDVENGCMRYIDGSNHGRIVPHVRHEKNQYDLIIPNEYINVKNESLAEVKKGGVVFHHGNTIHKSGVNTSNRWRRGYATHWVTPTIHSESQEFSKGYFYSFERKSVGVE